MPIYGIEGICMRLKRKFEVWFGKTCILGPLREECCEPIRNCVTLTAVTPCQSVFPNFQKGFSCHLLQNNSPEKKMLN